MIFPISLLFLIEDMFLTKNICRISFCFQKGTRMFLLIDRSLIIRTKHVARWPDFCYDDMGKYRTKGRGFGTVSASNGRLS